MKHGILADEHPELLDEWDFEKNKDICSPYEVTSGSRKEVNWKLDYVDPTTKKHFIFKWVDTVNHRARGGRKCPFLSNDKRKLWQGWNDLETFCKENDEFSHLIDEYDITKNNKSMNQYTFCSTEYVYWVCPKGHSYYTSINNRIRKHINCPYCSNNKVLSGYNDFESWCKSNNKIYLLEEWDYDKNTGVEPKSVLYKSTKKVFWKCEHGHEWETSINSRINGCGCPTCKKYLHTSFPEQVVYYYIKQKFKSAINSYKLLNNVEIDIYIPELKIGIEYDGYYWHKDAIDRDIYKNELCNKNKITLIRFRENGLLNIPKSVNIFINQCNTGLQDAVIELFNYLKINDINVDINRDTAKIYKNFYTSKKENSISNNYPELIAEFCYDKNYPLIPEEVYSKSDLKLYWKCSKCGNIWKTTPRLRTLGHGCPECAKEIRAEKKIKIEIVKNGSLEDKFPEIAKEWNHIKNKALKPSNVTAKSSKKVWWICKECGNEWEARVANRTGGTGCPRCYANDSKRHVNSRSKKVRCLENGKIFDNISLAERWLISINKKSGHIKDCAKGKREIAGGYHWEYVKDDEKEK